MDLKDVKEVKLIGFGDWLDVGSKRKEKVKCFFYVFGLGN